MLAEALRSATACLPRVSSLGFQFLDLAFGFGLGGLGGGGLVLRLAQLQGDRAHAFAEALLDGIDLFLGVCRGAEENEKTKQLFHQNSE